MNRLRATSVFAFGVLLLVVGDHMLAAQVNVTTAHQDTPAICTGCVYRTGQNLQENTLTYSTISDSNFGLFCSYSVDGQVFAQPLVVTNVNWKNQGTSST
jgi:hypothetical protein